MKVNPRALLFAAVAAESSGLGKAAAPASAAPLNPAPPAGAEAPKPKTRDPLTDALTSKQRKALESRLASKASAPTTTPPPEAAAMPPPAAADKPAAPPAPELPKEQPKPSDAEKPTDDPPEAGVIDFSKLAEAKPAGEDGAPAPLTEAELADLKIVQAKLQEAHKDNAAQRKLKRELKEAKEKLEADNKALTEQLEAARAQPAPAAQFGKYLDGAQNVEHASHLKADAVETLRQLQENPDADVILLPGNRQWKITDAEGRHLGAQIAQDCFDILDGYDGKVQQLRDRAAAETVVKDKLPLLSKALPDIEKSYQELLRSDWNARAPEISLDAALGKLVRTGEYVMVPAKKQDAWKHAPAEAVKKKEPPAELPHTPPPVREAKAGEQDLSHLKARAMKGDQKALKEWIQKSGKTSKAA